MTTTIEFRFPWGAYHATPWNRSANEGAVEWPPAPWRILRALYSSWMIHSPDLAADVVEPLLERLGDPPSFVLPEFTEAHTRHYFPGVSHLDGVKTDTDKTLDAFAVMSRDACVWATWPNDLNDGEANVLGQLLDGVRYLGRAESIVECSLVVAPGHGQHSAPSEDGAGELVMVADFSSASAEVLTATTVGTRKARRAIPEGSRLVPYRRPTPAAEGRIERRRAPGGPVTAVRFALEGPVAPSRFLAVAFGSLLHSSAVKKFRELQPDGSSPALSGRDVDGIPLKGTHQHAHYLVLPDGVNMDGRCIDSLLVWAPGGLTEAEVRALGAVRILHSDRYEGMGSRRILLTAAGDVAAIAPGVATTSRTWQSVTPYAPVHHHKGAPELQLLKDVNVELAHRGLPLARSVTRVEEFTYAPLKYRRYRPGKEVLSQQRRSVDLRIEFEQPLAGPLVLGQLAHFGLGIFAPVND